MHAISLIHEYKSHKNVSFLVRTYIGAHIFGNIKFRDFINLKRLSHVLNLKKNTKNYTHLNHYK